MVKCFEVEVQFVEVFGFEGCYFQFDGNQVVEVVMEEQKIQCEVLFIDLDGVFGIDVVKVLIKFGQKVVQIYQ